MAEPGWARVAEFGAPPEADLAAGRLESAGIPVLVRGPETGIFGPGFAGTSPLGVSLYVPTDRLEDARQLLEPD